MKITLWAENSETDLIYLLMSEQVLEPVLWIRIRIRIHMF